MIGWAIVVIFADHQKIESVREGIPFRTVTVWNRWKFHIFYTLIVWNFAD